MTCKNCGTNIAEGIETCTICGTKIETNTQENVEQLDLNQNNNLINNKCHKCGSEIMNDYKFCTNCGASIETTEQNVQNINNSYDNQTNNTQNQQQVINNNQSKSESLGIASLIIGIISIILSPLNILIIALPIIGIILGIVNKARKGKMISGIITNAVAIVMIIIVFFLFIILIANIENKMDDTNDRNLYTETDNETEIEDINPIAGNYNCTGVSEENKEENYKIILNLNKDLTFLYGPYKNNDNNYASGTYTYEDENKTNPSNDYKYYMLKLNAPKEDFVVNGTASTTDFTASVEFGLLQQFGKKQGVIMFVESGNIYYCYES